jgi:hypothetical protein
MNHTAKHFMSIMHSHHYILLLSYERLSKKPLLFKSFIDLTVPEFDDIYDKEITKKFTKHEITVIQTKITRKRHRCREIIQTRPRK